jgi:RNA ligase
MTKLKNLDLVKEMRDAGYIEVIKHPTMDIYICNYTKVAQATHIWNEATEQCRGVIVDADWNIVARPFNKFFNYEELLEMGREIPNLPFEVYEKLDGSLGILYWGNDGLPYISTRGSFNSDQAKHATQILHTKYADKFDLLDKSKTYCFEIIYPEDLHVVTYKGIDDIFLIGVFDIETGVEDNIKNWNHVFNTTELYDGISDYTTIRDMFSGENKEGFVIRFSNGFRMKLKFAEYWKLHFLKTGFSEKNIYRALRNGDTAYIEDTMQMFDEEHQLYYMNIINKYTLLYNKVLNTAMEEFAQKTDFKTRSEAADFYKKCTYPPVMFKLYDQSNVFHAVWRCVDNDLKKLKIS